MHKGPRIKALLAAHMLLVFLFVSFFGSEGTLLCFGKDGHMAIEFADVHNGSGFGEQLEGMENDSCGPCMDIQFLTSPAYTRNTSQNTQALSHISSSPVFSSLPQEEHSNKPVILSVSSYHKTLASLHSVVLLI